MEQGIDRKTVEMKVFSILRDILGDEDLKLQNNSRLVDDLEFSSLEVLELLSALEEEFDCRIAEKKSREFVTVSDIVEFMMATKNQLEA